MYTVTIDENIHIKITRPTEKDNKGYYQHSYVVEITTPKLFINCFLGTDGTGKYLRFYIDYSNQTHKTKIGNRESNWFSVFLIVLFPI